MLIEDYGFKGDFSKYVDLGKEVARIIATYREKYEIVCNRGFGWASIKRGCFYDNPNAVYPTTGDFVLIEWNSTGESMITETIKRSSSFSRVATSGDKNREIHKQHEQLVATNFDYTFIMQSMNNNFNLRRLERYLTLSWESGAIPVVILTKRDLVENYMEFVEKVKTIAIGVEVYAISCKTGEGLEEIKKYFCKGNTLVFLGSSGVGKSTLVNTLYGDTIMLTSSIREDDSHGRHTTTSRNLIMLPDGAMIIDTPGMRELGMWEISEGLNKTFADIEQYLGQCKFTNCTHTNEPGCKIIEAIENGELDKNRFLSYLKLQNEAKYSSDSDSYLKEKREKFKKISKYNRKR